MPARPRPAGSGRAHFRARLGARAGENPPAPHLAGSAAPARPARRPGTRGTGPGVPGRGPGGRDKGPARGPREAGAAGGGGAPRRAPQLAPNLQSRFGGGAAHLAAGPTESPGRPGHCPPGPRPPTRGGGQAAAEREQQQQRRRRRSGRPGRRRLHVVRSRTGPRRAHSGSMARLPGSSRGSGRLPPPPSGAAGQDDGGGGRRRGSGSRAASPPPAAAAAAALRAPRAGRALLRAPPGAGPPRGDRRARGPGASARAPCPWGPGAGAPRGRGGGRPVCTPRGLGPDRAPETGVSPVKSGQDRALPVGKLRHGTGVCERGCPRARALRQFQGWKPGAPSQVRALSGDRSHPSRVLLGAGPRHLFSPGRGPGKATARRGRDRDRSR